MLLIAKFPPTTMKKGFQCIFIILSTTKLSLTGDLPLEISAMISPDIPPKTGIETHGPRYRFMALRFLRDLFVTLEKKGPRLLDVILESIGNPYTSTIGVMRGQSQNHSKLLSETLWSK